jgi:hypothetical protein
MLFKDELAYIANESIRKFVISALKALPDYFFTIPASSSGKYHPGYALGEGGLVRHTKAAVAMAHVLMGNETIGGKFGQEKKDMVIAALILHDGCKNGMPNTKHTVINHPLVVCEAIETAVVDQDGIAEKPVRGEIYSLIKTHMGQWNKDRDGNVVLPKPERGLQSFVHMCDYLASRKMIDFNFDVNVG